MGKTTKPSGLNIDRVRGSFTCSWKTHSYDSQDFYWYEHTTTNGRGNTKEIHETGIKKATTSKLYNLSANAYFPYTSKYLNWVKFRVRGDKKKKKASDWVDKALSLVAPNNPPTISVSVGGLYSPTFSVSITDHSGWKNMWETRVQYQSCLVLESTYGKGDEIPDSVWKGNLGESIQAWDIWDPINQQYKTSFSTNERYWSDNTQSSSINSAKRPVRWFRARVVGPAGYGGWQYAHISYATPNAPNNVSALIVKNSSGYTISVDFKATYSVGQPIENCYIEYSISTPKSDLTPVSTSWTKAEIGGGNVISLKELTKGIWEEKIQIPDIEYKVLVTKYGKTVADKFKQKSIRVISTNYDYTVTMDSIPFNISGFLEKDQTIYIRVVSEFNGKSAYSSEVIPLTVDGTILDKNTLLAKPIDVNVTTLNSNLIRVTATNQSTVPDVFLAITLQGLGETAYNKILGVVDDPGTSSVQKSIAIPDIFIGNSAEPYSIIVQAIAGAHNTPTADSQGIKVYTLTNNNLSSEEVTWAQTLKPPSKPTLENLLNGNVRVSFDWKWEDAKYAEIAWSDYKDAMESNEAPNSYIITDSQKNSIIIKGLEMGVIWYFWVRYLDETQTTAWSPMESIMLSSAPNIPSLSASRSFVTLQDDDSITLSWSYVSTDTSPQASAKVAQVIPVGEDIVETFYGDGTNKVFAVSNPVNTVTGVKVNGETSSAYSRSGKTFTFTSAPTQGFAVDITYKSTDPYYLVRKRIPNETQEKTNQYVEFTGQELTSYGMTAGKTYSFACKVTSETNLESASWSNTVDIVIPEPITCMISSTSFTAADTDHLYPRLQELPFTVKIDGATDDDMTTYLYIERAEDYFIDRPDGMQYGGFEGETVVAMYHNGDATFTINKEDIRGYLDDTSTYRIKAVVEDKYGQSVSNDKTGENSYIFKVDWTHQAVMPEAQLLIDDEMMAAYIKIMEPVGLESEWEPEEGDVCDIYRASVDGYELVYAGARFGNTYADPYPTIGRNGGHRIVLRTCNGDTITPDNTFAWLDIEPEDGDIFESDSHIITFDREELRIKYNTDLDSAFKKDFQTTRYLGGGIEGDWNSGIEMTGSIKTYLATNDIETIQQIHRLAEYEGSCRVRTLTGANFTANIEVSENIPYAEYYDPDGEFTKLATYTLNIERVDSPTKSLIALGEGENEGMDVSDLYGAVPLRLETGNPAVLVMPNNKILTLIQPEGEENV